MSQEVPLSLLFSWLNSHHPRPPTLPLPGLPSLPLFLLILRDLCKGWLWG